MAGSTDGKEEEVFAHIRTGNVYSGNPGIYRVWHKSLSSAETVSEAEEQYANRQTNGNQREMKMKKTKQFIRKSGLLIGVVLLGTGLSGRNTCAKESNAITSDQAEERKERILTSYILDTEDILPDSGSLRVRVINSYDDVLRQKDAEKQDLSDTMYAVSDVNEDGMPELVIKSPDEGGYNYELYTYSQETEQVESFSDTGIAEMDAEGKLDFRYAYPKKIWADTADINADDQDEQVSVYALNNEDGYACILVYVNGGKALAVHTENPADKADIHIYPIKKQKALFYLRLYSDTEDEYCALFQFSENQLREMVNMDGETKTAAVWPLAYGRVDLDMDGEKELILRRYTAEATEGGAYIYHVYHYDKDSRDYTELPDALFSSRAAGKQVFFEKETGHLLINETMGDPAYGVYTMSAGALHEKYEVDGEIRDVPHIKFKKIEFQQETAETAENQTVSEIQQSEPTNFRTPFYGIWCCGSRESEDAGDYANSLRNAGYPAEVYLTTDWSNLNTEKYYVVTAGIYETENDANANLVSVQNFCPDAYVKYSGNYQGM